MVKIIRPVKRRIGKPLNFYALHSRRDYLNIVNTEIDAVKLSFTVLGYGIEINWVGLLLLTIILSLIVYPIINIGLVDQKVIASVVISVGLIAVLKVISVLINVLIELTHISFNK